MELQRTRVLIQTKDTKLSSSMAQILVPPVFEATICTDPNEARRKINESYFEIIIVDSDDGNSNGIDFAIDISESLSSILLLTPSHLFDQISYKVEPFGILTVTKPFDTFYFYNMIKVALAVQAKVQRISSQTVKLKEKMEEIRLVNRAKMLLIQNKQMTEQEAHRFIEKQAMDNCVKRTVISQKIIDENS